MKLKKLLSIIFVIALLASAMCMPAQAANGYPDPIYEWDSVNHVLNVKANATTGDGVIFYEWKYTSAEVINIGEGITDIAGSGFSGFSNLKSVTFPNTLESIGDEAFSSCYKLESITIPDSVVEIGQKAFRYCTGLKEVKLSNSLKEIPYECFANCNSLTSIDIPASVKTINSHAFYRVKNLKEVRIPENTVIKSGAFEWYDCSGLSVDVYLPATCTIEGSS